jgi:hypothetical protein
MRTLILLPLLLAACAPRPAEARTASTGRELAGVYELGFERQTFRPCGAGETWWVGTAPASLQRGLETRAYVRVRATVGPRGAFGHLGRYPRQIHITEAVHVAECPGE